MQCVRLRPVRVPPPAQAGVGLVGSALGGGPLLSSRFHAALEASIQKHFPANHAINCMCHSTENLYRWDVCGMG
jgi:hypothetical protein